MTHDQIFRELYRQLREGEWPAGQKLPTERTLAEKYGVSRPTISRVLNRLSDLGFLKRIVGSGSFVLEQKDTAIPAARRTFGLSIPGLGQGEIFEPICARIAERSNEFNFTLIWGGVPRNDSDDIEYQLRKTSEQLIDHSVDGVFLQPLERVPDFFEINQRIISLFEKAGIPLVLLDCDYLRFPRRSNHDLVGIDNVTAAYTLTSHFLHQGCQRIDFIWQPFTAGTLALRLLGYRQALLNAGIQPGPEFEHEGYASDPQFVCRIIDAGVRNIICENDETAALLMHNLEEYNLKVPKDIRIAGFDDIKYAHLARVPITTIKQPCLDLGDLAIRTMIERIEYPALPPRMILVPAPLQVRASSIIP